MKSKLVAAILTAIVTIQPVHAAPEPRVFNTIVVDGNDRFRDQDILATSGLQTGDLLGVEDLRAAAAALEFTGEFRDVRITSQGDVLTITVREEPEYTGGLTFGLGYDSDSGILGVLGFSLLDVHGEGTEYRGTASVAQEAQTLGLSYRSPRFWGGERSGGVRFSFENYAYDNDAFDFKTASLSPYYNFRLGDQIGGEFRYTLSWDELDNVDASASNILQSEAGSRVSSGVGISLITGSDLAGRPGLGGSSWSVRFDQDFTGLGGDTDLSTSKLSFFGKLPIGGSGLALRSRVELGTVTGLSGDNPIATDRFFLGGAALRGFERGSVSPRDVCVGCGAGGVDEVTNLGGNHFAVARTDLLLPIFTRIPTLETFIFGDVGASWGVDTNAAPTGVLIDDRAFRTSAGIGLSVATQLGTFESYLALSSSGETYDQKQAFGLTFRSEF